ncbi:hypothetical protein L914_06794, partial [Phytophthora nicotianae]
QFDDSLTTTLSQLTPSICLSILDWKNGSRSKRSLDSARAGPSKRARSHRQKAAVATQEESEDKVLASKVRTELTFFVGEQVFAVILPAINSPTASSRCCGSLTITGFTLCPIRFL